MKRIIFLLISFMLTIGLFSQEPAVPAFSKEHYLKKYKSQKTAGWVLLGGGLGMVIIGGATYKVQFQGTFGGIPLEDNNNENTFSDILVAVGLGAMITSIPVFISAHKNKKKAASLSIDTQPIVLPSQNTLVMKIQPAISFKIPL